MIVTLSEAAGKGDREQEQEGEGKSVEKTKVSEIHLFGKHNRHNQNNLLHNLTDNILELKYQHTIMSTKLDCIQFQHISTL